MQKIQVVNLFLELVKISSPSGEEKLMIDFVKIWLQENGFRFKIDQKGNILGKYGINGKPILFCAHMDTVSPGHDIKPLIKDGYIQSDGSTILGADNKASLAAILTGIEEFLKYNNRAIEVLLTVKEETGGGVEFFPIHWLKARYGFIFDSSNPLGGLVLRSPYISNFNCRFIGVAAHSSKPEEGINAFIPAINSLHQIKVGLQDDDETTINIGKISGGVVVNTVPAFIEFSGEVRSYKKRLFEKHLKSIQHICNMNAKQYATKFEFIKDGYCSGYSYRKNSQFIRKTANLLKNKGFIPNFYNYSAISDANVLISKGINVVNLADGTKNPHTMLERIKIEDLIKLKDIVLSILENFN